MNLTVRHRALALVSIMLGLSLAASGLALAPPPAAASGGDIVTFADPADGVYRPIGVTAGPDGNVWFTSETTNRIGRITPAGVITTFPDPAGNLVGPNGITTGADGNLWFTSAGNDRIGRITPAGVVSTFVDPLGRIDAPTAIARGGDGNVWFVSWMTDRIGRITPAGVITTFTNANVDGPAGITRGPDGNVWFTMNGNGRIGRITPAGGITTFADPAGNLVGPSGITSGPDGNLWFTDFDADRIGRVTPTGVITSFTDPAGHVDAPYAITSGPDGKLWFTNHHNSRIGRITPAGLITTFTDPQGEVVDPIGIARGADGNLWFASVSNHRIGRIEPLPYCNDSPPAHGFSDVPAGVWYEGGLNWAKCHRLVAGYPDNTFRPGDVVKRSQIVSMLHPMVDPVGPWPPHGFTDVPADAWYGEALSWAKWIGIVSGFPGPVYRPGDPVNRAQVVSTLWNLVGHPAGSPPHGFSDVPADAWYGPALNWAKAHGIVSGFPGNVYRPGDPVLRSQIVAMLFALNSDSSAWSSWGSGPLATWRF